MLSVLLVEDDLDLAATLVDYLLLEDIQCDHASNGVAGLTLMADNEYRVLLLDLNLPRLDGISICQRLRQLGNDTPILMLTARDQLTDKRDGFQAGTDDYLVKPFEMSELVMRVKALARRRSGQVMRLDCGDLVMDLSSRVVTRGEREIHLSPTGWILLETLLRASPAVVSRRQLAQAVWGDEAPDSNSLKVHLFNLRKSVDGQADVNLMHTLAGQGIALRVPDVSNEPSS
ncbi:MULTISPECIES: response regulator transcription factor [unclassified Oceanobacter]|uniref:response regulator transcription factor n=2 Tax=Gammaproteobacteria TaxID=1236 RepID=UPI0026E45A74|nr:MULTISPECIES: response regulator transcription factor [unclassified Oceanobacter]MDO6682493.1 response regulator transcription factor [Oceanobacter sp. 5_MG-2023]MDP2506448.1 response regulator transcription factor [Oceanobacter sp. 3_MG-2023]MDP2548999.1 response regulator transcription factor [Oceanobacter sp. 4_MG-2023]MDP2609177.1 response regulator transcription factor [Oceanobacter sp. 1_MG-2023]MDP2612531.1 response regulator transcription factor [Oceanobacter sp. 2_MG-2023]